MNRAKSLIVQTACDQTRIETSHHVSLIFRHSRQMELFCGGGKGGDDQLNFPPANRSKVPFLFQQIELFSQRLHPGHSAALTRSNTATQPKQTDFKTIHNSCFFCFFFHTHRFSDLLLRELQECNYLPIKRSRAFSPTESHFGSKSGETSSGAAPDQLAERKSASVILAALRPRSSSKTTAEKLDRRSETLISEPNVALLLGVPGFLFKSVWRLSSLRTRRLSSRGGRGRARAALGSLFKGTRQRTRQRRER